MSIDSTRAGGAGDQLLIGLLEDLPRPAVVIDADERVAYANLAHLGLTGLRLEQVVGRSLVLLAPTMTDDGAGTVVRLVTADGSGIPARALRWAVGEDRDVLIADPGLHTLTGPHLDEILTTTSTAVVMIDPAGRIVAEAGGWRPLLGIDRDEPVDNLLHWVAATAAERIDLVDLHRLVETARSHPSDVAQLLGPAPDRITEVRVRESRIDRGRLLLTFRDITDQKHREDDLTHAALSDPLTDLPNRVLGRDRIHHAVEALARTEEQVALLFVDLDRFGHANHDLGHVVADEVLTRVAARLGAVVRPTDTVIRWGGDEFVVLLERVGGDSEAIDVAERIRATIAEPVPLSDGGEARITASVGVVVTEGPVGVDELLADADQAMYEAKAAGGDALHLIGTTDREDTQRALTLTDQLRTALVEDRMELRFQPLVDLATGRVLGAEALLRWQRTDDDLVLPWEFLPQARRGGLTGELSRWMLDQACATIARWEGEGHRLMLGVDLSADELDDPRLVDRVASAVSDHRIPAHRLSLEVSSAVVERSPHSGHRLQELTELGVRVALSDFGSGPAPLDSLGRLVVDTVKLAPRRIDQVDRAPQQRTILQGLIRMAADLGVEVVAEGVERAEHLVWLRRLRCPAGQGTLLGAPMPGAELLDHLGRPTQLLDELEEEQVTTAAR